MVVITAPSRLSRVSGPVRLTRIRPGSRSRTRVVISAARVVLPVPPIPQITIPASPGPVRSAGQRRCSRRRPTKYQSSRPASPAIRGRDGCRRRRGGAARVQHRHRPGRGQDGHRRPFPQPGQLGVPPVRGGFQLGLDLAARLGQGGDHVGVAGLGQGAVDAGQQPGGVGVGDRGLGGDHRRRAALAQPGRERGPVLAGGGVGVARRQGDHRRHPPRRDRLVRRTHRR